MEKRPHLYLIDGSSYFYRAFYAIKQHLTNSQGLPTNAIYGFFLMLLKIIKEEKPDYLAMVFDSHVETFRHQEYSEYKSHRPEMPSDLARQIPYIHTLIEAFNIPIFQKAGFEADDIIGTIADQADKKGFYVTIVSGDKDLMQLINPNIRMLDTLKQKYFTENEVMEKFGVMPEKIIDVLGLMGDSSDNIPGVPGIGEKGAIKLIQQFGSIEGLLNNISQVDKKTLKENLEKFRELALLSKRLCTILKNVEIELYLGELKLRKPDQEKLIPLLRELEFTSFLKELDFKDQEPVPPSEKIYHTVLTKENFENLLTGINSCELLSLDLETTHEEPMRAEIVGISFCFQKNEGYYIPLKHSYPDAPQQLPQEYVFEKIKPTLENPRIKKIGQNIKYDCIVLNQNQIEVKGITFDTMIASYLLNPAKRNHNLEDIAMEYSGRKLITFKEVTGNGKNQISFAQVKIDQATQYCCQDSEVVFELTKKMEPLLQKEELYNLFEDIEIPLITILGEIEKNGVKINARLLKDFSLKLDKEMNEISRQVFLLAGEEFNLNSPKQLADILFNKLKLKPTKKTKTGFSTDMDVLDELSDQHPLPATLLTYRQLLKLKSTYADGLVNLINPRTNRIHTSFNQTITATGRLSSSNPNLQNIPIRTENGKEIRKAFIAEEDHLLLSADYSQIELRILAHFSGDKVLIENFQKGEDVHTYTSAQILGLPIELITNEMRRMGKTINFGIIYGISPYGLARDLKIPPREAKKFIEQYFRRYEGVKKFIEQTIEFANQHGYITTLLKRKRYLPELKSTNKSIREFGERMAINTPIQGSAADIIKLAMISISEKLKKSGLKAKMIIQVHDELVFEFPEEEEEILKKIVKEEMENVISLSVPLTTDIHIGKNWNDAH